MITPTTSFEKRTRNPVYARSYRSESLVISTEYMCYASLLFQMPAVHGSEQMRLQRFAISMRHGDLERPAAHIYVSDVSRFASNPSLQAEGAFIT